MSKQLDNSTAIRSEIKEMPERALQGLKNGVGRGKDGRIVIGSKTDLKGLTPYLRLGHTGLVLDEDLLAEFARYNAPSATNRVSQVLLPESGADSLGITKEQCEICKAIGIDGVLQKAGTGNKKLVVNSQGLLSGRDSLGNQWVQHYMGKSGIDVLSFDYFEGENKVEVSFQKRVQDLMQIIQSYSDAGYEVGGHGSSFGGSALWNAASLLSKQGTQLKAIAHRTIIPNLLESFAGRIGSTPEYIRQNPEKVCELLKSRKTKDGVEEIRVTPEELAEMSTGKFNLDKYIDVNCPVLDIQGSEDTAAGMHLVRNVMRQLKQFNANSQLVEIAGATHGADNRKDVIMQMYLLVSFLKKHMLDGNS